MGLSEIVATFRGRFVLAVETVQLFLGHHNDFSFNENIENAGLYKKYPKFRLGALELTCGAKKGLINYGCKLILSQSLQSIIMARKNFDLKLTAK